MARRILIGRHGISALAAVVTVAGGVAMAEQVMKIPFLGVADFFIVSEDDTTPDAFIFAAIADVVAGTVVVSEEITVTGIDVPVPVNISGSGTYGFRINDGPLVTVGGTAQAVSGDRIVVSLPTAPGSWETRYEAVLSVGGGSASFVVDTGIEPQVITLSQTPLPDAEVGVFWSHDFREDAGVDGGPIADPLEIADLTWSVSAGSPPQGMSLDPGTGVLSGTPTSQEAASFTVTAASLETSADVAQEIAVIDYTAAMETEWDIPNPTATLPLRGDVDVTVDWGSAYANEACLRRFTAPGNYSCTYEEPGLYTVRIAGTLTGFGSGELTYPNAEKLVAVTEWGGTGLTSLAGAFHGAENLTTLPDDFPETVTDISDMFRGAVRFNQDLSSWGFQTRNLTKMDRAFQDALDFDGSLQTWCTPKIKSVAPGFRSAFRATGPKGISLGRAMKLSEAREPRWGSCGMDLAGGETPSGDIGSPFTFDVKANAALWEPAPAGFSLDDVVFSVVEGELPPGLTLNPTTGEISGSPMMAGSYSYKIRAVHASN